MIYILYLQPTETQLEFFLKQEEITYFNPKTESSTIGIKNAFARDSIDAYKEKYPFEILFIRKYNVDDAIHPEKIYITADEETIDFLVNSPMIRKILPIKIGTIIQFPKNEHQNLKKLLRNQKYIYTTRISKERKYKENQELMTPWGVKVVVDSVSHYKGIENHPFFDQLTDKQKDQIGNKPFDLIKLKKIKELV